MNKIVRGNSEAVLKAAFRECKKSLCLCSGQDDCTCPSCRTDLRFHPDFLVIETDETVMKKEHIEEVFSFVEEYPSIAPRKVVLIKGAEKMNVFAANSLLKVLEDGPGEFVLVTDRPLLKTIESRCKSVKLSALDRVDTYGLNESLYFAMCDGGYVPSEELCKEANSFVNFSNSLSSAKEKRDFLRHFHLLAEKDDKEFFSCHTKDDMKAFFRLIIRYFIDRHFDGDGVFSELQCLEIATSAIDNLGMLEDRNYTKNNFFQFVAEMAIV